MANILYIYAVMIPCFAVAFTIVSGYFKQPLPSLFATIFWFASSLWTINITYVFDFTTGLTAYYVTDGNPEVGTLFMVLGVVMGLYTLMLIVLKAAEVGWLGGNKDGE